MKNEKYAVILLFESEKFTARELEEAIQKDSKLFLGRFFDDFLTEDLKEWCDACKARGVLEMIYTYSFMYGACGTFDTFQREGHFGDVVSDSCIHRPRLFSQIIVHNKDLKEWIDKSRCIDLIYRLYENSYTFGGYYMMKAIESSQVMFDKE